MKIRTLFIVFIVLFIVFIIYYFNVDNKKRYFYIGDFNIKGISLDSFSHNEMRTTDLINYINDNKRVIINDNSYFLQNVLVKVDFLNISVGINDVLSILESENVYDYYKFFDSYLNDVDYLFSLIRVYCKENIIFIGIYNPFDCYDDYFSYINNKLYNLCLKYNINYIDVLDVFDNSYLDGIRINDKGYSYIKGLIKNT